MAGTLPATGTVALQPEEAQITRTSSALGAWEHQLYKAVTVFVRAEQHLLTKDLRNLQLIEIVKPGVPVDETALETLWQHGSEAWKDVASASGWVEEIRGN